MGNTTTAAAVTAALTGADPARVTGFGTGVDADGRDRKVAVVRRALDRAGFDATRTPDPVEVLRQVGGSEVGLLAGVALGCAADRTPVVDGVVSGAAALVASALTGGFVRTSSLHTREPIRGTRCRERPSISTRCSVTTSGSGRAPARP